MNTSIIFLTFLMFFEIEFNIQNIYCCLDNLLKPYIMTLNISNIIVIKFFTAAAKNFFRR